MIRVFADSAGAAAGLAERVVLSAHEAIAVRGEFRMALSGGETPVTLYRLLASEAWRERIDWWHCVLLLADERAVPVGDAARTDRLVRETLLEPLGLEASALRSMRAEAADLEVAALEYEAYLRQPLDLLLLGMGQDGHIASLFPDAAALRETERRVVAIDDSPKPPPARLTVTPRVLNEARAVCVLTAGQGKAAAVARALDPQTLPGDCPAVLAREDEWYIDRAAASALSAPLR